MVQLQSYCISQRLFNNRITEAATNRQRYIDASVQGVGHFWLPSVNFKSSISVQFTRPIYGSNYMTHRHQGLTLQDPSPGEPPLVQQKQVLKRKRR